LELTPIKGEILQSEPAVVQVKFTNTSPQSQRIDGALEAEWGRLVYHIVDPKGTRFRYQPIFEVDGTAGQHELAPGGSLVHREMLICSVDMGATTAEAGDYKIQATYIHASGQGELRSNVALLAVREPAGGDAEAVKRFRGNPQALFAAGATSDWAIGHEFETVVHKFPESAYAPWSHYFLGRSLQRGQVSQDRGKSERAIAHFQAILDEHPDFPLAVEVRYQIAKELLRLGKKDEALKRIDELGKSDPNFLLFQRARREIDVYMSRGLPIQVDALP
jgi:TolA-binding protein